MNLTGEAEEQLRHAKDRSIYQGSKVGFLDAAESVMEKDQQRHVCQSETHLFVL